MKINYELIWRKILKVFNLQLLQSDLLITLYALG